jgi:hypothetical protein
VLTPRKFELQWSRAARSHGTLPIGGGSPLVSGQPFRRKRRFQRVENWVAKLKSLDCHKTKHYVRCVNPGSASAHACDRGSAFLGQKPEKPPPRRLPTTLLTVIAFQLYRAAILSNPFRTSTNIIVVHAPPMELALRRNLPLATLDNELIRACKAAGGSIL